MYPPPCLRFTAHSVPWRSKATVFVHGEGIACRTSGHFGNSHFLRHVDGAAGPVGSTPTRLASAQASVELDEIFPGCRPLSHWPGVAGFILQARFVIRDGVQRTSRGSSLANSSSSAMLATHLEPFSCPTSFVGWRISRPHPKGSVSRSRFGFLDAASRSPRFGRYVE